MKTTTARMGLTSTSRHPSLNYDDDDSSEGAHFNLEKMREGPAQSPLASEMSRVATATCSLPRADCRSCRLHTVRAPPMVPSSLFSHAFQIGLVTRHYVHM